MFFRTKLRSNYQLLGSILVVLFAGCGSWMPWSGEEEPEENTPEIVRPTPEEGEIMANSLQLTPLETLKIKDKNGLEIGKVEIEAALVVIGNITTSPGTQFEKKFDKVHILNLKDGSVYGAGFDYSFEQQHLSSMTIEFANIEAEDSEVAFSNQLKEYSLVILGQSVIEEKKQTFALQLKPQNPVSFSVPDLQKSISEFEFFLNLDGLLDFSGSELSKQNILGILSSEANELQNQFAQKIAQNLNESISYKAKVPENSNQYTVEPEENTASTDTDSNPTISVNNDEEILAELEQVLIAKTSTTNPALPLPNGVKFNDTNLSQGFIGGRIEIARAEDESQIDAYMVYWGKDATTRLNDNRIVKLYKKKPELQFDLISETTVPENATHLLVYTITADLELSNPISIELVDNFENTEEEVKPTTDPYLDSVEFFLRGDGDAGTTELTDLSKNNHPITINGDVHLSSNSAKFGSTSIYFDGQNDWLSVPNSIFEFGTKDFTIEFWADIRNNTQQWPRFLETADWDSDIGMHLIFYGPNTGWVNDSHFVASGNTNVEFAVSNGGGSNLRDSGWHHYAFNRSGTKTTLFVDGKKTSEKIADGIADFKVTSAKIMSGNLGLPFTCEIGYIEALRVTVGLARYTEDFDPMQDTYLNP